MIGQIPCYRTYLLLCWILICCTVHAQEASTVRVSFSNVSLAEALSALSTISGVRIVYSPDMLPERTIDQNYEGEFEKVLVALLANSGLDYRSGDGQVILYRPASDLTPFVINGYIEDANSGERLIGAHVYDLTTGMGNVTNEYGFFSVQARGEALLRISYLGYVQDTVYVPRAHARTVQMIRIEQLAVLPGVVIEENDERYVTVHPLTSHHITGRQLANGVVLGGEQDIQRFMEDLPGVSIGIDGVGGLHVRGGDGDQNLILFDGVPIYHSTHAIGILSVFNPLMIREASLEKGEFPARYAGRLSSVLDVRTKEGNNKQWSLQSNIGIATMNALVEGPLIKDKAGVLIAARKFVPGFYLRNLSSRQKAEDGLSGETQYGFTDLNVKCNISPSERDRFYLSFYHGSDSYDDITGRFLMEGQGILSETFDRKLSWGNAVGILRWNHHFGKNLFMNATATLSKFEFITDDSTSFNQRLPDQSEIRGFINRRFESRIRDTGFRIDFDHYVANRHRVRYGLTLTRHTLLPKSIVFDDEAIVNGFPVDERELDERLETLQDKTLESGVYIEDEFAIEDVVRLSGGVHLSRFDVRNTTYWSLQPRIGLTLKLFRGVYGHLSAGKMTQYLHLLTSSGIGLPTDLWVPSTPGVKPQHAYQASAGFSFQPSKHLNFKADYYIRRFENLIAYKEGASFLFQEGSLPSGIVDAANWENKVTRGSGQAWGIEFSGTFTHRFLEAGCAYTYGRSTREFDHLNNGKAFDSRFDRSHALSLTASVHLNANLSLSAGWNYASGIPITLAVSRSLQPASAQIFPVIQFPSEQIIDFTEKNAYRLPDYHRLDFGARYVWRKPKATHSLQLDLYNVYNRDNILYVTLVKTESGFKNQQFTVLPLIPSLSYHLKI